MSIYLPQRRRLESIGLSNATLSNHAPSVKIPDYDRTALTPSIVHIGVGGFHRAHQAVYLDDLADKGVSTQWGVTGVGLHSSKITDALGAQDGLYTVVERCPEGDAARVIGALTGVLHAGTRSSAVIDALSDPRTRVVGLTITGNGYHLDGSTGQLDTDCDEIKADLSASGRYTTAVAYMTEALRRRRRAGVAPFTVLSCDNLPDNGRAARTALVSFAALRDPDLARWIDDEVAFPSSMVDRITPSTSDDDRERVLQEYGIVDRSPVSTEPFRQWVVEDSFCNGRPPLEDVGVHFVPDVTPYKSTKTRMLNATHCALSYIGLLTNHGRVHDAMRDPVLREYIRRLLATELATTLDSPPGMDLEEYQRTLMERLSNSSISDTLARLGARGSTKMPSYLVPAIVDSRRLGHPHPLLTFAVACWIRYLRGVGLDGRQLSIQDARAAELTPLAVAGQTDPSAVLGIENIFGSLGRDASFVSAVGSDLALIDRQGVRGALDTLVRR